MGFNIMSRHDCPAVQDVAGWDLRQVAQALIELGLTDKVDAEGLVTEYQRYWALLAITGVDIQLLPPSSPIDRVWDLHAHRFPDDYAGFCCAAKGLYIGYAPRRQNDRYYGATIASYAVRFGQPDPRYWPE